MQRRFQPLRGTFSFLLLLLTLLLLVAAPDGAAAFELDGLLFDAGETLIGNAYLETPEGETVQASDVSPLTLTVGGGARFRLGEGGFRLGFTTHFWTQEFLETPQGPIVPTQIETGAAAGVSLAKTLGIMVGLPVLYHWQPEWAGELSFGGGISPSLVFRVPYAGIDGTEPDNIRSYYLSEGRYFYPESLLFGEYRLNQELRITLHIRALWPIYNGWDGEETPFMHEFLMPVAFGVRCAFWGPCAAAARPGAAAAGPGHRRRGCLLSGEPTTSTIKPAVTVSRSAPRRSRIGITGSTMRYASSMPWP